MNQQHSQHHSKGQKLKENLLKKNVGSTPYHEISLTKVGLSWMPAFISTTDERVSCRKSEDTTYSTWCG